MPVVVACRCGQRFQASDDLRGSQVPCPVCGQLIEIDSGVSQVPVFATSYQNLHRAAGPSTAADTNWALIAAVGGAVAVLFLLVFAIGVPFVFRGSSSKQTAAPPAKVALPSVSKRMEIPEAPTSTVPLASPESASSTALQADPSIAEPIIPAVTIDTELGEVRTFGEGRFQLWIPTKSPPKELVRVGTFNDYEVRMSHFEFPDGTILTVWVMSGTAATHEQDLIDTYQQFKGNPKSPLEVPTTALMQDGVAGYGHDRKAQKHIKAGRSRVFYYADRAIKFGYGGTDAQVFTPEIDYFLQSLKFGSPVEK